jgi:hypothetical protein
MMLTVLVHPITVHAQFTLCTFILCFENLKKKSMIQYISKINKPLHMYSRRTLTFYSLFRFVISVTDSGGEIPPVAWTCLSKFRSSHFSTALLSSSSLFRRHLWNPLHCNSSPRLTPNRIVGDQLGICSCTTLIAHGNHWDSNPSPSHQYQSTMGSAVSPGSSYTASGPGPATVNTTVSLTIMERTLVPGPRWGCAAGRPPSVHPDCQRSPEVLL